MIRNEVVDKIAAYSSHPTADIIRPFVKKYTSLKHVRTDFPNYMRSPSYINFWDKALHSPGPIIESYNLP